MTIHSVYDNNGATFDRYTVYYGGRGAVHHVQGGMMTLRSGRGMSENPRHPQGFGQYTLGMPGKHNGRRITFEQLPAECQAVVMDDLA